MTDGSWESEAAPAKKGMPTWAKVSLGCCGGCALVFILLMATCVGGVHWVSKHGVPGVLDKAVGSAFLDKVWADMDRTVQSLRTEQGTKALYAANPGLSTVFPTEEDFLKEAEEWRPKLGEFPAQRPTLQELVREPKGSSHFNVNTSNGRTSIEYQIPKGGMLHLELEAEKLVDVRVE